MDANFIPVERVYKEVALQDPSSNRIAQWLDKSVVGGILDLSHPMIPEAVQGSYTITALTDKGEQISHSFDIKEYVLPKYEVNVHLPSVITVLDQEAALKICGKYTYGKPVIGSVKAQFCRNAIRFFWFSSPQNKDLCKTYELTTDKSGCATQTVNVTAFSLHKNMYSDTFEVTAEMEEYGTGRQTKSPTVHRTNTHYAYGLRRPNYRASHHHVTPFYSKSSSFLKVMQASSELPCDSEATVRAQYIIQGEELEKGQEVLHFFYLVCVRDCDVTPPKMSVPLTRMSDLAPFAQVVVYTLMPSGEAVADSHDFPVQLCLNNKVSLKFSSLQELPSERTTLSLKAHPGSLCSVRAIDQSVLLLQTEQELTVSYEIGLKIMTNSDVKKPYDCDELTFYVTKGDRLDSPIPLAFNMMPEPVITPQMFKVDNKKETIRTFFPETWIWDLVTVGDSGLVSMEKTTPDTITKWAAGAFCVSSVGFGVAPNTGLTVFQPFFVSLTLPYSVIRGEVFTLKATVFNYLLKCIMVKKQTNNHICFLQILCKVNLKVSAEALKTEALCGNEVATVPDVGRTDTVIRTLLVEVTNSFINETFSSFSLLLLPDGVTEKNVSLLMPELFVAGSARATFSVLGDLMGRAAQNLDKLLAMPYGCGEQNMLLFAPNIFILNYLKSTGQLTQSILDKATHFLESGYQRELTYKHDDGSYSAFGKADSSGNTWLTSFVMKSFGGAQPYIYVQPEHITEAWRWLSKHQRPDGCIRSVGKLFHNGMKVTIALFKWSFLIISFWCFKCSALDKSLLQDKRGTRHWKRAGASGKGLDSLEVEMTSYVLLALLSGPSMPGFDLEYSSGIVRWLTQQQNPFGGFSSTQDTVVALQALAKYGAATYSSEVGTTVTLTSLGGLNKEFTVNQDNRLLYQEEKLSEVPGEYTIRAEGQNCVLTQVPHRYVCSTPSTEVFSFLNRDK
uniref:Alpha-2-macroglobulin n=1 Tax=Oreochromis niloticus TaxID=8128 RepID=A0A669D6A7_ORENI